MCNSPERSALSASRDHQGRYDPMTRGPMEDPNT